MLEKRVLPVRNYNGIWSHTTALQRLKQKHSLSAHSISAIGSISIRLKNTVFDCWKLYGQTVLIHRFCKSCTRSSLSKVTTEKCYSTNFPFHSSYFSPKSKNEYKVNKKYTNQKQKPTVFLWDKLLLLVQYDYS